MVSYPNRKQNHGNLNKGLNFTRYRVGLGAVFLYKQMAKEYAKKFYSGIRWRKTREAYAKSVGYLCENCLANGIITPGLIVHHKTFITPDNINDPNITLNADNLVMLCKDCHEAVHNNQRFVIKENGAISPLLIEK